MEMSQGVIYAVQQLFLHEMKYYLLFCSIFIKKSDLAMFNLNIPNH